MKEAFVFIFSILLSSIAIGQTELYSVYFEKEHPLGEKVKNPEQFYGTYTSHQDESKQWIFNQEGIFIAEIIPLKIPKESVRESSKYTVRNGYIFGVKENDSLPYIDQTDCYLVGIPNMQIQADWKNKDSDNEVLTDGQNSLYLHYKEGDFFSIIKLTFTGNALSFQEFNYEEETIEILKKLKKTDKTKLNKVSTLLIKPKSKEWEEFNLEKYFKQTFSLSKSE